MRDSRRLILPVLALAAALVLPVAGARRTAVSATGAAGPPGISALDRAATFRFAPGTAPADRDAVLAAVARARPPARRLVALVDGLTEVRVGATGTAGVLGLTENRAGRYTVTLDLRTVAAQYDRRGIDRVVLHELGHVIDAALVPPTTMATLQAGIPSGYGCDGGTTGGCAAPPERFAESFAKWATGDIGVDLYVGYKVPPPGPTLDAWGAPLAQLAPGR
jgi:hypothetical protein